MVGAESIFIVLPFHIRIYCCLFLFLVSDTWPLHTIQPLSLKIEKAINIGKHKNMSSVNFIHESR